MTINSLPKDMQAACPIPKNLSCLRGMKGILLMEEVKAMKGSTAKVRLCRDEDAAQACLNAAKACLCQWEAAEEAASSSLAVITDGMTPKEKLAIGSRRASGIDGIGTPEAHDVYWARRGRKYAVMAVACWSKRLAYIKEHSIEVEYTHLLRHKWKAEWKAEVRRLEGARRRMTPAEKWGIGGIGVYTVGGVSQ